MGESMENQIYIWCYVIDISALIGQNLTINQNDES